MGRCWMIVLGALVVALGPARPAAADPPLSVPHEQLDAALACPDAFDDATREPVLLVHGTGTNPPENWGWNYAKVLPELGWDVCTVTLPNRALDDIQVSSEYVVHAILTIAARSGEKVDVMGHSQGGLQPRWAVKWWEAARAAVDDLITLASPNHGTVAADVACLSGCSGAVHQMKQGSAFLDALNADDETPGEVSYSSIYSLTDELVQPAAPVPTAALDGASNIALQDVCPGRPGEHALLAADAVVYELVVGAFTSPGPADASRVDPATCLKTSFDGVSAASAVELGFEHLPGQRFPDYRPTAEEPPLAAYTGPAPAPGPEPEAAPAPAGGGPGAALPRTGAGVGLAAPAALAATGLAGIALRRRL